MSESDGRGAETQCCRERIVRLVESLELKQNGADYMATCRGVRVLSIDKIQAS